MGISTHILDTTRGRPAAAVGVALEREVDGVWRPVGVGTTDPDGRVKGLLEGQPPVGTYRITFAVDAYFQRLNVEGFYPQVSVAFHVRSSTEHYHVPLLLNPFGYSTYRGS